jgi:hypothetical protein
VARFLSRLAGALARFLGLRGPLAVPRLDLPPASVPHATAAQVPHVPRLPGRYTPMTGGMP